jgi:hypothetical protein
LTSLQADQQRLAYYFGNRHPSHVLEAEFKVKAAIPTEKRIQSKTCTCDDQLTWKCQPTLIVAPTLPWVQVLSDGS